MLIMNISSNALEKIGLTAGESKTYLSLVKLGTCAVGKLYKESGLSRSKTYEVLERLIEKGLASNIVEDGVKKYKATNPQLIPEFLERQKAKIEEQKEVFDALLPTLMAQAQENSEEQSVVVFSGWEGIGNIFKSLIKDAQNGDKWYALGMPKVHSNKRDILFSKWRLQTDKIGIDQYLIANENIRGSAELSPESKFSHIKYLNQETPTTIDLFKDNTLIGVWSDKPIVIHITSKEVSGSFKKFFDELWLQSKP